MPNGPFTSTSSSIDSGPFASSPGGGGGTTYVGAEHITLVCASAIQWLNMPAALTEVFGTTNRRVPADLTHRTTARIYVGGGISGFAGSELRVQYSLDSGSNWVYLDASAGPAVSLASINGNPTQFGSFVNITAAAKTDVLLRVVGIGGNDGIDPTIGHLGIELR